MVFTDVFRKQSFLVLLSMLLAGCSSTVVDRSYDSYLNLAGANTFGAVEAEPRLAGFQKLFGNLSKVTIEEHFDRVYSEDFYLNDTFHTFTDRAEAKRYMIRLADVAETRVWLLDAVAVGDDVLVRWKMNTKGKVFWKVLDIESVGFTHLRFNAQDKIIIHQDYWDGVQGFYSHLPFIGSWLSSIRSSVGSE